ncbi:hypothetical protein GFC29_280 [Anoxybacillus sp. B7M1]|jgi:hypothetical protein|uniref:Methylthioribose kinase n=1 Tax=Anoxybacteroides rupiense TaxID=311460 RepID=A0ABD5IQ24_9BACL|nr:MULTISPECIES: hypothetical protein [Anoxybacillus]ANB56487.1 hypothetical protein GFC28_1347 [Anoxybacillus sp. B2M1]ANB63175.1 hypothetical protein GFC29_280 [Anoxybacillus sp. B7M1]KXG10436.1 hypothetical protein AT864_01027 [Anoxybacillus sp. P3H1B]MBB3906280.1 hypothetical protein [Anoxybacillus rupiensis]MBS2770736.1 methylthioribose kinase [Anoxybacillus rupiensis]
MIQRFIELGEGYSDIYELIELAKVNQHRLSGLFAFHTVKHGQPVTSLVVVLHPTDPGDFQPLYICREGIPNPSVKPNKRYDLFAELAKELNLEIIHLEVKPSTFFAEVELYYQHLIGIMRMNRFIPPLQ